jgi:hypothetical protein
MNRNIKQMQNEITRQRRGYNYMSNRRIPIPEQRWKPPPENRVRFENTEDPPRPRVPRQPTPNATFLDVVCDKQSTKK